MNTASSAPPPLFASVGGAPSSSRSWPPFQVSGVPSLDLALLIALAFGSGVGLLLGLYRLFAPNCRPDQILVIAGRGHRRRDGQMVGYRVVHGGRSLALPLLERCSWMDVRCQQVPIQVVKAYAKGGTPIDPGGAADAAGSSGSAPAASDAWAREAGARANPGSASGRNTRARLNSHSQPPRKAASSNCSAADAAAGAGSRPASSPH